MDSLRDLIAQSQSQTQTQTQSPTPPKPGENKSRRVRPRSQVHWEDEEYTLSQSQKQTQSQSASQLEFADSQSTREDKDNALGVEGQESGLEEKDGQKGMTKAEFDKWFPIINIKSKNPMKLQRRYLRSKYRNKKSETGRDEYKNFRLLDQLGMLVDESKYAEGDPEYAAIMIKDRNKRIRRGEEKRAKRLKKSLRSKQGSTDSD